MDRKAIRTDDQRLERNLLIEYNRQKRAQGNQQLVLIYFYIHIFIFGFWCFRFDLRIF